MEIITIEVWDATGNRHELASLPHDEPVNCILVKLANQMNLPAHLHTIEE